MQCRLTCTAHYIQVKERVYPLIDAVLKRATGATRTLIFDHTLRNGRIE